MRCLVYQYWTGDLPVFADVSRRLFADYAAAVGAEYRFDRNPDFFTGRHAAYHHAVRPVFDPAFHAYDRVLYVDMDVFPTSPAAASIFDEPVTHLAMAPEPEQPAWRARSRAAINGRNDRRWAAAARVLFGVEVPRDEEARPLVYNSGVILYGREGMIEANRRFPSLTAYTLAMRALMLPRFYRLDQNYLGVAAFRRGMVLTALSTDWNCQVHRITGEDGAPRLHDPRHPGTAFVHLQVRNRRQMSEADVLGFAAGAPPP